jgi:hypothetical protein
MRGADLRDLQIRLAGADIRSFRMIANGVV